MLVGFTGPWEGLVGFDTVSARRRYWPLGRTSGTVTVRRLSLHHLIIGTFGKQIWNCFRRNSSLVLAKFAFRNP